MLKGNAPSVTWRKYCPAQEMKKTGIQPIVLIKPCLPMRGPTPQGLRNPVTIRQNQAIKRIAASQQNGTRARGGHFWF